VVYPPDLRSLGLATFMKEVEESTDSSWSDDESRQQRMQERLISEFFVSNLEDLQIKLDHSVRSHVHAADAAGDAGLLYAASSGSMQGLVQAANGSVLYIADGSRGFRRPGGGEASKKNLEVRDFLEAAGFAPGDLDAPFSYKSGQRSLRRHGLVIQV
jgi:hypothetical protein